MISVAIVLLVAIGIGIFAGFVYTVKKINKMQKFMEEKQHQVIFYNGKLNLVNYVKLLVFLTARNIVNLNTSIFIESSQKSLL